MDVGELTLSPKQSQALIEIEQAKHKLKEAKQAAVDGEETYQKARAEAENELSRAKLRLSAVTESQVIAAVLTFLVLFLGYMMDSILHINQ